MKVPTEQREEVIQEATKLQTEEEDAYADAYPPVEVGSESKPAKKSSKKKPLKARHIKAAARTKTTASISRSRKEIMDFFVGVAETNKGAQRPLGLFAEKFVRWANGGRVDIYSELTKLLPSSSTQSRRAQVGAPGGGGVVRKFPKTPARQVAARHK